MFRPSWNLVLATFEQLDRIIASSKITPFLFLDLFLYIVRSHVEVNLSFIDTHHLMFRPSWNLVLATFEQLDRIIASSKITSASSAAEAERATSMGGADAGTKTELSILRAALDNLFTSVSVSLDDEAVSHFLTALSTQVYVYLSPHMYR